MPTTIHEPALIFGNPEFFRYNVAGTLHPLRVTAGSAYPPLANLRLLSSADPDARHTVRHVAASACMTKTASVPASPLDTQFAMLSVIIAYVLAMALIGGAELARYMLPVVPLVILLGVSTFWRRVGWSRVVIAIIALMFVAGWFINPPYGFAPEDNLAYRDYIRLHQNAEAVSGGTLSHGSRAYRVAGKRRAKSSLPRLRHAPDASGSH